jgi:hypothetical protein
MDLDLAMMMRQALPVQTFPRNPTRFVHFLAWNSRAASKFCIRSRGQGR